MSRKSEKIKNDTTYYCSKKLSDQRYSDYCTSRNDVDVVIKCIAIVKASRLSYLEAKRDAPHNVKANQKAYDREFQKMLNELIPELRSYILTYIEKKENSKEAAETFDKSKLKNTQDGIKTVNTFANALIHEVKHDIHLHLSGIYPTQSETKIVKYMTMDICRSILKKEGFGKKRINEIIPLLTEILKDEDDEFKDYDQWLQEAKKYLPDMF